MTQHYNILNGDALLKQFPENIEGETIICRECLVDGDVKSKNLDDLFHVRARFINECYGDFSVEHYYNNAVAEFDKIRNIPKQSIVNLWFEDDLFCQVNFWFVCYLLQNFVQEPLVFLIRPKEHTLYGFGGLSKPGLEHAFAERIQLNSTAQIAGLWEAYKNGNMDKLLHIASKLKKQFPFIKNAVNAHIARIPNNRSKGRPTEALVEIIQDLKTDEFGPVFREFNKREYIYGFGDLQVKRLLDEIKRNA